MGDSVLIDLLNARSERKETRMFAHASAETQEAINESHRLSPSSRPSTSQGPVPGKPAASHGAGFLEVFPRAASRPPRLLQELQALLVDRLRVNDRLASTSTLLAKERDPGMAANLSLDGHRQVLTAFIQGFSAYSSLLARIQEAFEQALKDGLHCAVENIHVREQIREEAAKRKQAATQARAETMKGEQRYRQAAYAKLQEAKEKVARLTKRAQIAERERDRARQEEASLENSVATLRSTHARLKALTARETTHASQPISGHLLTMKVRPLSKEDKILLEQEHGAVAASVLGEAELSQPKPTQGGGGLPPLRTQPSAMPPPSPFAQHTANAEAAAAFSGGGGGGENDASLPPGVDLTPRGGRSSKGGAALRSRASHAAQQEGLGSAGEEGLGFSTNPDTTLSQEQGGHVQLRQQPSHSQQQGSPHAAASPSRQGSQHVQDLPPPGSPQQQHQQQQHQQQSHHQNQQQQQSPRQQRQTPWQLQQLQQQQQQQQRQEGQLLQTQGSQEQEQSDEHEQGAHMGALPRVSEQQQGEFEESAELHHHDHHQQQQQQQQQQGEHEGVQGGGSAQGEQGTSQRFNADDMQQQQQQQQQQRYSGRENGEGLAHSQQGLHGGGVGE